jgi:hypothetical protein
MIAGSLDFDELSRLASRVWVFNQLKHLDTAGDSTELAEVKPAG